MLIIQKIVGLSKYYLHGFISLIKYSLRIGYADKKVIRIRRKICKKCPMIMLGLDFSTDSCSECGCYILPKTALRNETCPIDKW